MSAFMVSKRHIDAIVTVAEQGPDNAARSDWRFTQDSPTEDQFQSREMGDLLAQQNARSLRYAYENADERGMIPAWVNQRAYTWMPVHPRPSPVEALSLLAGYEYQSCEHPEWETSTAKRFCERLRAALVHYLPGYDQAPWTLDEWPERKAPSLLRHATTSRQG